MSLKMLFKHYYFLVKKGQLLHTYKEDHLLVKCSLDYPLLLANRGEMDFPCRNCQLIFTKQLHLLNCFKSWVKQFKHLADVKTKYFNSLFLGEKNILKAIQYVVKRDVCMTSTP